MKQPLAYVHPAAKIASNVVIDPFVTRTSKSVKAHALVAMLLSLKVLASEKIVQFSPVLLSRLFLKTSSLTVRILLQLSATTPLCASALP